ncbi:hypothetical protein Tco_1426771, partial [Tanacetum coccineum]
LQPKGNITIFRLRIPITYLDVNIPITYLDVNMAMVSEHSLKAISSVYEKDMQNLMPNLIWLYMLLYLEKDYLIYNRFNLDAIHVSLDTDDFCFSARPQSSPWPRTGLQRRFALDIYLAAKAWFGPTIVGAYLPSIFDSYQCKDSS